MNTDMPRLPRIAYSADDPVSPDVAPRILSVAPSFASTCSKRLPRSQVAVGEAQEVESRLQRRERRDFFAAESGDGIGASDDALEISRRDVVDVARKDFEGEILITEVAHSREILGRQSRVAIGHDKAAVGCKALDKNRRERLRHHPAAGAHVAHRR